MIEGRTARRFSAPFTRALEYPADSASTGPDAELHYRLVHLFTARRWDHSVH